MTASSRQTARSMGASLARAGATAGGAPGADCRTPFADTEARAGELIARGDHRAAIALLMAHYGDDLYRLCASVLGDASAAEDVHQNLFIQAMRDLPGFSGRSTLRTWLYAIARHRCLDALKSMRRRRARFLLTRLGTVPDVGVAGGADASLERRDELRALRRALATLSPRARIAVLLRYQEGLSYAEMAQVCGERAGTLQARVARALIRMRRVMEDRDGR